MKLRTSQQRVLALALALALAGPAAAQKRDDGSGSSNGTTGVPTDQYTASLCESPFEDIAGTGTPLLGGVLPDDGGEVVPLGFSFEFFGVTHTDVGVSSNGYLTFGPDLADFSSDPIPNNVDPNDLIAVYWDDWDPGDGVGTIHYQTLGTAPNRRFIAQWTNVPPFPGPGDGTEESTFQAVLHEGSDGIEYHYGALSFDSPDVGIESPDGTEGIDLTLLFPNENLTCLRFDPVGEDEPVDLSCEEFDRFEDLTPNDTLTVVTKTHNPQQEQGYLYAYAVTSSNQGVGFDNLIGQLLVVDGLEAFEYSVNPVDYRAVVGAGELTDVDADGVRDLNAVEYEKTAGEILVPRFLGHDTSRGTHGDLILIALSGGTEFTTTADFLIYNDDEDVFSANRTFYCWDKVDTLEISSLFSNDWLVEFSGQNPLKGLGALEYGWFRVEGGVASSSFYSLLDPAVYAVYVEQIGGTAAADLPFETCTQSGHLLPRAVSGDNEEENGAPSDEDCDDLHTGRKPASLLLYPEFDNRAGVATVVTVTNTSETDDVRVHFVYLGRYGL